MKKALLLFFLSITATYGQILGCTDPLSKNYNSRATENDGSCVYKSAKIKPEYSKKLSDSVKETSGLIAFDPQDYYSNKIGAYYYQMRNSGNCSSNNFSYDFKRFIDVHYRTLFNNYKP